MDTKYKAAYDKNTVAIQKFKKVQSDYRARIVDDATFLAAKAEYEIAMAEFDVAYAEASNG